MYTPLEQARDINDADLVTEFVMQADVAERTRHKYRVHLEEFRAWLAHPGSRRMHGPGTLLDATPGDVQRFIGYLRSDDRYAASDRALSRGQLSASARKNTLSSLRSFYRYLLAVRLVTVDPTATVRTPRVTTRPGLHLSADELRQLLAVPGTPRERAQVYLLAFTAARMNEIRNLRWDDVDFASQTILLRGKRDEYRHVDIHPRLMTELRRWYIEQERQAERNPALQLAKLDPSTNFVLLSRNGKRLPETTISKQLKARAVRAGLYVVEPGGKGYPSRVSPHVLRRTLPTLLLNDGQPIDAVADVLGHRSIDTTRKHYAFSSDARRRATIRSFTI